MNCRRRREAPSYQREAQQEEPRRQGQRRPQGRHGRSDEGRRREYVARVGVEGVPRCVCGGREGGFRM